MKKVKLVLFAISIALMIWLLTIEIGLHKDWYLQEKEYVGQLPFLESSQSKKIEMRLFNIDMGISFLGFINLVVIGFYFVSNYQKLVDRWRKIRGIESKTLMALEKDLNPANDSGNIIDNQ